MSVRLMLPGEVSLVTCPPDYAYDKFERLVGRNLVLVLLPLVLPDEICHHKQVFSDEKFPLLVTFYNHFSWAQAS